MTTPVPLSAPFLGGNEWRYLKECLDTSWVSSAGPFVEELESRMGQYCGAQFGVAVSSGTAALHLALLLAGVQTGDEVLVSDLTFVASVNAIFYAGATPVLVDAEASFLQMDCGLVRRFLMEQCERRTDGAIFNKTTGRRVGAILPVHVLGHPVDLEQLVQLCSEFGVPLVEDCAEALGAKYRGRRVGCHGLLGCVSFNGNKIVTAGGGGILLTNNEELARRGRYLSTQAKDDAVHYIHEEIGFNYRLTNLQAAVAVAQLEQLPGFLEKRRQIAGWYEQRLAEVAFVKFPKVAPWAEPNHWLSAARLDFDVTPVVDSLGLRGIQTRPLWRPMHLLKPCKGLDYLTRGSSVSEELVRKFLCLPSSVTLSENQVDDICRHLVDIGSKL